MRNAVGIAREAFVDVDEKDEGGRRRGKVLLSLGAYGAIMVPSQEYGGVYDEEHRSVEHLREWHFERLGVFLPFSSHSHSSKTKDGINEEEAKERRQCWDNINLIAFETLPLLSEIVAARETIFLANRQLEKKEDQKPFWITCVFPGKENKLPDGSSVKDVVSAMIGEREGCERPMGIGINCTSVGKIEGLVREFEDAVMELEGGGGKGEGVSLVIYPDGTRVGESYNTSTHEWEIIDEGNNEHENQVSFFFPIP